ncbi:tyrosine-type recombinase/integrase [Cupriavidus pinatubonensis]|uniref:Tyrosine recombinase XerC n=1 Tax=Cupriavidus pinatubonensis TaxID=248026 RepID=A0ABN7ZNM1_9BURK|nr:tyrosine-type recombinase/integrase [Cupriavidus pinatubonensis]CAG9187535.1 Tyrosine recombinase XerC [Cupriavidus pinatubonensis]
MYETLFKHPAVLARYRAGPYAEAREQFVESCAQQGYSRRMQVKIAWILMSVAPALDLSKGALTTQDVQRAIEGRMHFLRQPAGVVDAMSSRPVFTRFVVAWLQHTGMFAEATVARRFVGEIDAFTMYLRDERGLSPVTIATRSERLAWFFDSVPSLNSLAGITIGDVDAFVSKMHDQGWSRASLCQLTSSLRSFLKFAAARGWCSGNLAAAITSPRVYAREGIPQGPAWQDVQRLLDETLDHSPVGIRDHAILLLLALYGLRRGEVAMLHLDDLDWHNEIIWIRRTKQRRTQRYPLLPKVGNAILRYLRDVRPRCACRELFLALSAPNRALSADSITAIVHNRINVLGIPSHARGAHCLRHACAQHLLGADFTLKQIGDHLGHRSVNSTMAYTKVDIGALRRVAELDLARLL